MLDPARAVVLETSRQELEEKDPPEIRETSQLLTTNQLSILIPSPPKCPSNLFLLLNQQRGFTFHPFGEFLQVL